MHRLDRTGNRIQPVAECLRVRYHDWAHHNRRNPLEELLFIICSTRTPEAGYRGTYRKLRMSFRTFCDLANASESEIAEALAGGGLQKNKARAIRGIVVNILDRFGRLTLAPLKHWSDSECEKFLTELPGVGKKVARCVMMYSLGREVFPVDTHCWRISCRLGWVRPTQKDRHCAPRDMDRLQDKIPPHLRYSLHVNMVSLGREICTAKRPDCGCCPIEKFCNKAGVVAPLSR